MVPATDPVEIITPHLKAPEDSIRCAAARALGALGDEGAAPALVDALLDPDPDVRADAMAALVRCARPQDAPAIRRSLQGDPVGEVKTAAVRTLGRLEDGASTELLRALARDRCESEVAWEEGSWDDWLDVQVAAIMALGDLGAESAVDDLIRARAEEGGQELDHVVFAALAKMPGRGVAALLDFLNDGNGRVRERALAALSRAGRDRLTPLRDRLVADPSPGVRRLAADCLDAGDTALSALVLKDPEASVRAAAVGRVAPAAPDLARAALADPDPHVRATALEGLAPHLSSADGPALAAKLAAWLWERDTRLAVACASVLPTVMGAGAASALRNTAADGERLAEVRIAALQALGEIGTREAVDSLPEAVSAPVRQVRVAALAAAAAMTRGASEEGRRPARDLLIEAMRGDLRSRPSGGTEASDDAPGHAAAGSAGSVLAITPEGGIVAADAPELEASTAGSGGVAEAPLFPRSTLEAIQAAESGTAAPSHDPSPSPPGAGRVRSRRVRVEGVDDSDADIRLVAVRLAADCAVEGIDEALAQTALSTESDLRAGVFEAIAQRAAVMPLTADLRAILIRSLASDDARVRCAAARGLAHAGGDATPHLIALIDDADASVRAAAVTAVGAVHPARVAAGFRDSSPLVRRAAVDAVTTAGEDRLLEDGLGVLVDSSHADSLMDACARHIEVTRTLIGMLSDPQVSKPRLRTMLEALGGAGGE
ncbi:MAG: HEAT repeat domain-containing protein [Deltaproteobacteria bacterium]|nr:HEAT repeat domain-containing protein [Deltaproteobacteria bacterium]